MSGARQLSPYGDKRSARDDTLYTFMHTDSAHVISRMLAVFFPDAATVLDATYGHGAFWNGTAHVKVTGVDIDPDRAPAGAQDFRHLTYPDQSFDLVVLDPPFQTDEGKGKRSIMGSRYESFKTVPELIEALRLGCLEARRVARLGAILKCQDYIHASKPLMMTDLIREFMAPTRLYQAVHLIRPPGAKVRDTKWRDQLSAYSNGATFLAFRWDGIVHRRRKLSRSARVMPIRRPSRRCDRCRLPMSPDGNRYRCQHCQPLPGMCGNESGTLPIGGSDDGG